MRGLGAPRVRGIRSDFGAAVAEAAILEEAK
jgi:hypothetical protein